MYCWSLAWRILSTTLLASEMNATVHSFEHSLSLPFFGIEMKMDLLQSCGYCWVFQTCWHIECNFIASSFRIWNSSTGIPSPPLALFILMLPTVHFTSHPRMSVSRWVIIRWWFLGHQDLFCTVLLFILATSSWYLLLLLGPYLFCLLSGPSLHEMSPWYLLIFLKRSLVFPILLFSSVSFHWSLRKAFSSFLAILWNSAFRCLYLFFSPLLFASLLYVPH